MNWISVKERLPEHLQECLFTHTGIRKLDGTLMKPSVQTGFYRHGVFKSWIDVRDDFNATHWMPLPEPPKE